ncbi:MAG: class I SAM-dependent methyltransferase [Actinomycetota bacterium]|nr:class I SAM-dependent methyltransferase [Actinomycetota bacterium]
MASTSNRAAAAPDLVGYAERAAFYSYEHADTVDQRFLAQLARTAEGPLLEVPCGSGRNLRLLAVHGKRVTGVDIEPAMVAAARQAVADAAGVEVRLGDMRSLSLAERVGLVLVPREAIQLLPSYTDALDALRSFQDLLRPGGTVMLDLATFAPGATKEQDLHPSYFDPRLPDDRRVRDWSRATPIGRLERRHWQRQASDAVTIGYHYEVTRDGKRVDSFESRIRLLRYSRSCVLALLAEAGLRPRALLGDYHGRGYREGSPRLIVVATAAEG